ncbi:MAG: ABC-2 type transport system ATP-binding protein [Planctomycetota bacterium]|jgi:ABC-2 type transport system ATP-binding protein
MNSTSSQPALALQDVSKHISVGLLARRVPILRDINLELAAGEAVGLLGPNGSGKSTLLRLASGIDSPNTGRVQVFGENPQLAASRRQVGFVPEGTPFPGELNAALCLELCASLQGLDGQDAKQRCSHMLDRVGLSQARGPLRKFSKGMLRRFALAQAFVHSPTLLLLDEPSSGLDAEGLVVLAELVQEARDRGAALIVCSHYLEEALGWTDRVALLNAGQLHNETSASLSTEGHLRLEVQGLDAPAISRVEQVINELGGQLVSKHPSPTALLEIYRKSGKRG